jgi:hypothetical protein
LVRIVRAATWSLPATLRTAASFVVFPAIIGAVEMVLAIAQQPRASELPRLFAAIVVALCGFYVVLCLVALVGERMGGAAWALRSPVVCPECRHEQPIVNLRCTKCEADIGVPAQSRASYLYCVFSLAVFQCLWMLRDARNLWA